MRSFSLAMTAMVLLPAILMAQQPLQQSNQGNNLPPLDPENNKLDFVLLGWEKAMSGLTSLEAQCNRTEIDKVFQAKEQYTGVAKYLKTKNASMASLEMKKNNRPDVFERYICTGTFFYQFIPQQKIVRVHDMPKPKHGGVSDNNFLSFLFGMKAAEAKQRYHLQYVDPPANDQWYHYLRVIPKNNEDKADFKEARLVLFRSNYMPRQLWFQEPNGNEIIWDFPRVSTNGNLSIQDFSPPQLPQGWRYVRVPQQAQPRAIRNNDQ